MANTIEIIIKATDQASAIVEKTEAKIVASNTAIIKSYDAVSKNAQTLGDRLQSFGADAAKIGDKLSIGVTLPLVAAGAAAVKFASDLNETTSKVGVLFGDMADDVKAWSKDSATAFGLSQRAALDGASTFAVFGKAAKLSGNDLLEFSESNVKLASDMASFFNTNPEEAIGAIGAAFRGESEPIRRYGVLINDVALKDEALRQGLIKTTTEALTPQQRILAAQGLILQQTSAAQGDFARTADGVANATRIAKAQFEDAAATLGTNLLPLVSKGIGVVNGLLQAFKGLSPEMQNIILASAGFAAALGPVLSVGGRVIETVTKIGPAAADAAKSLGLLKSIEFGVLIAGLIAITKYLGEVDAAAKASTKDLIEMSRSGDLFQQAAATTEIMAHGQERLREALDGVNEKLKTSAVSYDDYRASIDATAQAAGFTIDANGNLIDSYDALTGGTNQVVQANYALTEAQFEAIKAGYSQSGALDEAARATQRAADTAKRQQKAEEDKARAIREGVDDILAQEAALALYNQRQEEAVIAANELLKIGLAGQLEKEAESFADSQADLVSRSEELRAEIEKLQAGQGRAVEVQDKNTLSSNELALAQLKLADAQTKLSQETDPLKQADLAVKIDDLNAKVNEGSETVTRYVDNSKRIGELTEEYDKIQAKAKENAATHEEATRRILFGWAEQKLAIDGITGAEQEALDKLAVAWGLKSQRDVEAFAGVTQAIDDFSKTSNANVLLYEMGKALDTATTSGDLTKKKLEETQSAASELVEAGIIPLNTKLDETTTASGKLATEGTDPLSKSMETAQLYAQRLKDLGLIPYENEAVTAKTKTDEWKGSLIELSKAPYIVKVVYQIETRGQAPDLPGNVPEPPAPPRQQGGLTREGLYYLHDDEYILSRAMRYGQQAIPAQAIPALQQGAQRVTNHVNNFYDSLSTAMWIEQQRQEELDQLAAVM